MLKDYLLDLKNCNLCPRECRVDRFSGKLGYCKSGAGYFISSICIHHGEEPIISGKHGIVNIFFSHCNLQCIYCQNHQISNNQDSLRSSKIELNDILHQIIMLLNRGINAVGFVSPGHFVPQVKMIIQGLKKAGHNLFFVYNTNGYDKVETLKSLEGLIDVYLPDFKYLDSKISKEYSDAENYPETASKAIIEMYRQKGSTVIINDESGQAESGLIIRHLVLPGNTDDSINILRFIAEELSTSVYISLMSQYYPTYQVKNHPVLNRNLYLKEYQKVVDELKNMGFRNGWIQSLESHGHYRPDFEKSHPFQ